MSRLPRYAFDQAYVQRLIAEDPDTERHFTEYFGALLSLKLRRRLRSHALVQDVTQETFVRVLAVLKQKRGLSSPGGLGAFVNSVCNNILFEVYRSGARADQLGDEQFDLPAGASTIESTLLDAEQRRRVHDALNGLPQKDRELLKWLFFDERDKNEICRRLNVDREYLRVLLHRAKLRFRDRFAGEPSR